MTHVIDKAMNDRGYTKVGGYGEGVGYYFQKRTIHDLWMWTGKYTEYTDGTIQIRTVKVDDLREAAYHYWMDGWIPIKGVTDELLRAMEEELRQHRGLQKSGVRVPDEPFLEAKVIPEELLKEQNFEGKTQVGELTKEQLASLRAVKQADRR